MQFKFFVGIDVSKDTLDFSVVTEGKEASTFRIENSIKAIKSTLQQLNKMNGYVVRQSLLCLE